MNVNKTDLRIILELQKNGRASYVELAGSLGISPITAARRTERLISSRTICVRAIPNPFRLGLVANALIGIKCDPTRIEPVVEKLRQSFHVNNIMTVFGRFDILSIAFFPRWEKLHDFINTELANMEGILDFEVYHIRQIKKRYHHLFGDGLAYEKPPHLKEIDSRIIEELAVNGRAPTNELARKLGAHTSTLSRRINALLKAGLIKISAVPNPTTLGYASDAIISMEAEPSKVDRICADLSGYREINLIATLVNGSGVIVGIHTLNNEILHQFIKDHIAHIDGVQRTETHIRARIEKRYYGWFLEYMEEMDDLAFQYGW